VTNAVNEKKVETSESIQHQISSEWHLASGTTSIILKWMTYHVFSINKNIFLN